MQMHLRRMSIQLAEGIALATALDRATPPALDKQTQILGLVLSDPKAARQELAIFPPNLDLARRKARAGGFSQGALFCGLDPVNQPCHPDDPPKTPVQLQPSFSLTRLLIDYFRTSLDFQFLLSGGADVIFETARLWRAVQSTNWEAIPSEWSVLRPLVQLNLNWTVRLWTMLGHTGKQQNLSARLGLSEQEIRDLAGLADQLPAATRISRTDNAADDLTRLVWQWQNLVPDSRPEGPEAGLLARLAMEMAGLVIEDEELAFSPVLPAGWQSYALRLTYRGSKFTLQVKGKTGTMVLTEGSAIPVVVNGLEYMLEDEFVFDVLAD